MNYISNCTRINQINIPGTHDSETYAVGSNGRFKSIKYLFRQTHSLNMKNQLESGIRYLDIRLGLKNDDDLYMAHDKNQLSVTCLNEIKNDIDNDCLNNNDI